MVIGKSPFSPRGGERRARRRALRAAILAALLGFGACSPVDTWRDLTGANRNDPDPDTTPNTQNLAAGEAADYPNLATVPPPPTRAMTAAERDKLTQSLISDRANARYTAEQLRAGFPGLAAAPPPPPGSAAEPENVRSAANLTGPTPAASPPSSPGLPAAAPVPAAAAALAAPASGRAAASRVAAAPAALVAPTTEPSPTLAPTAELPDQTKAGGTKSEIGRASCRERV